VRVADEETLPLITGAVSLVQRRPFDALRLVRREYPKLELLFSEGCIEYDRFSRKTSCRARESMVTT
jgi:hypothetical protein